jgi:hypothetical protein
LVEMPGVDWNLLTSMILEWYEQISAKI